MFGNNPEVNVCGLYFLKATGQGIFGSRTRQYLPLASLSAHAAVLSSVSRTKLTQTFINSSTEPVTVRYAFPLYDGVSIVGFTCTINNDRMIRGLVQEKQAARTTFNDAIARGETAGLLEQLPDASDVFTTDVGNVPAGAEIRVDIVVLGELKHDAEVDGVRYTLPTRIAPRYGAPTSGGIPEDTPQGSTGGGISITVDIEMQAGSTITSLMSPSHPIGVTIGSTSLHMSLGDAVPQKVAPPEVIPGQPGQPQLASATLSLGTSSLDKDFVLQILATNISNPVAILETHPTIRGQRALMTTLVPKFNLPPERPEIVFVCDRSGSMSGQKIINLKSALQLFLKSLPVGVKFNICSFGDRHSFLFPEGSRTYDADSLNTAMRATRSFGANYGGTELLAPIRDTFDKRDGRLDLEVFVLTDGQTWNQHQLFDMVNLRQEEAKGSIRLFTLGIGDGASSALIEGLARAGNGFAQSVGDNERLDKKVVRMLKAALTPHILDYTLEVKYRKSKFSGTDDGHEEDFELIDSVADLTVNVDSVGKKASTTEENITSPTLDQMKPISLFDPSVDPDVDTEPSLDIPIVSIPRIMQSPFKIAPLFPFNRTNVYLLLSPETADDIPETVTLRATSKHGPLVLEIPVTTLTASSGETIHQLAARKAGLELEQGRGWIFHAKHESVLLKKAYPRQFGDMVQREAVRLGVQFQVGGKWCSFVAVEDNKEHPNVAPGDKSEKTAEAAETAVFRRPLVNQMSFGSARATTSLFGGLGSTQKQSTRSPFGSGHPAGVPPPAAAAFSQPLFASHSTSGASLFGQKPAAQASSQPSYITNNSIACSQVPQAGGLFGQEVAPKPNSSIACSQVLQTGGLFGQPSHITNDSIACSQPEVARAGGLFEQAATPESFKPAGLSRANEPNSSLFGHKIVGASAPGGSLFDVNQAACFPMDEEDDCEDHGMKADAAAISQSCVTNTSSNIMTTGLNPFRHLGSGGCAMLSTSPELSLKWIPTETPLETIVRLQSFDGFWTWNDALVVALGVKEEQVASNKAALSSDAWATITVLAFLRKLLAAEKESWELIAEKALVWLESQVTSDDHALIERMIETVGQGLR